MATNDDLISRRKLLAAYDAAHKGPPGGARKLIENAPPEDAERYSYWISYHNNSVRCAHCGRWTVVLENFCPSCGFDMTSHTCRNCKYYREHIHNRGDDSRCARHNIETRAMRGCEEWKAKDV